MAAQPVAFGSYNFPSVNKAKLECNRIRDKYIPNGRVLGSDDDAFFRALVEEHRHRDEKIGKGIEYFQVAPTKSLRARSGNFGVWIKQVGVEELVDFGYGGVIEGIPDAGGSRQEMNRVDRALRGAIRPATDRFLAEQKASGAPLLSCLSGAVLDSSGSIDVVHDSPRWGQLVRDFTALSGGLSQIETDRLDRSLGEVLVDEKVQESWTSFHEEHAVLGLATPEENAARPRLA
ncbi:DUF3223 domain-containing protein [Arthrobacter glacialis]|uniref:DUF3223 domain-containing protein n=1 Tax=Arthrobacter glacialis TaxID=1664 RepID=A0A2S3ZZG5_ARTGL|nr:DUF3223 domain-containing protein [Arthrobacter glacialis]POH74676.1 hypothetical protein CVS27_05565 [Arthrobacter glacialis]